MKAKGYKFIPVMPELTIVIPEGLPPEQEAALIAERMAEVESGQFAREYAQLQELQAHPERAVPMEDILRELELMDDAAGPDVP